MKVSLQPRAVVTRENVLRAAAQVFEEQGFAAATIAQILDLGGVTKGALYFHFASKEALARAIIAEQSNWRDAQVAQGCNSVQQMVDLSHSFARALQTDPLVRASIRLTLEKGTFAKYGEDAAYSGWLLAVEDLLGQAKDEGLLLDHVDVQQAGYVITAAVTGTQLVSEALTGRVDLHDRIEDLWVLLLPSLVPLNRLAEIDVRGSSQRRDQNTAAPAAS